MVAPFVGAWIEIDLEEKIKNSSTVAPFVGAWIEIRKHILITRCYQSLPSWERGLKSCGFNL